MRAGRGGRYLLLDGIRGAAIVNVVIFHFLFDVFMVCALDVQWYRRPAVHLWQQSVCWTLILVAGTTWHLGKNPLKRGIVLNLWGLLITVVTLIVMPAQTVWFGILSFMGCACLLMLPLKRLLLKLSPVPAMAGFFLLFLLFRPISEGYLGVGEWVLAEVPHKLYEIKPMTILGMPFPGFSSGDYFPMLPWFFLYVTGWFFGRILQKNHGIQRVFRYKIPIFTKIGQKSLAVYLLHQPLCMGMALLLVELLKRAGLIFIR